MQNFTEKEITLLKKQAESGDLRYKRDALQDAKTAAILVVKQKASADIDAINDEYNPQIEVYTNQINAL